MNIIVTSNNVNYNGFLKVSSLKEVSEVVGKIEYFVYHKSSESQEQKVDLLSKIKGRVDTMIYIRSKDKVENAVRMIVVGSEGKYIDDEFFLESSDELSRLIGNINDVTTITQLGGVPVLTDFFNRYLKDGGSDFNSSYLLVVKDAMKNMISEYRKKDMEILQLSTTATEIFTNSSEIIRRAQEEQQKMQDAVLKLEELKSQSTANTFSFGGLPSVVFFPTVLYPKEKNIIRIKEIGSCSFLTSFILGFRLYCEYVKNVRPKLIIIEPIGAQYEKRYESFNWVTQKSVRSMQGYYNQVVFTNHPSKDVLVKLLDDTDYDTFIVVDRLKTSNEHILNSKGNSIKYAINGKTSIEKFNLQPINCFSFVRDVKGCMFTIPMFPDYPESSDQRERLYLRSFDLNYEALYTIKRR